MKIASPATSSCTDSAGWYTGVISFDGKLPLRTSARISEGLQPDQRPGKKQVLELRPC